MRELDVTTQFRQAEAELLIEEADSTLALGMRASLEQESRRFAEAHGYLVDCQLHDCYCQWVWAYYSLANTAWYR